MIEKQPQHRHSIFYSDKEGGRVSRVKKRSKMNRLAKTKSLGERFEIDRYSALPTLHTHSIPHSTPDHLKESRA
jgi:hypothetical protein